MPSCSVSFLLLTITNVQNLLVLVVADQVTAELLAAVHLGGNFLSIGQSAVVAQKQLGAFVSWDHFRECSHLILQ